MEKKNSYQVFMEEAPEAAAAFNGLIQSLAMPGGLDQKIMQLVYIGIQASQGNADAVLSPSCYGKSEGIMNIFFCKLYNFVLFFENIVFIIFIYEDQPKMVIGAEELFEDPDGGPAMGKMPIEYYKTVIRNGV